MTIDTIPVQQIVARREGDPFSDPFLRRISEEETDLVLTPEPMTRQEARQATDAVKEGMSKCYRQLLDIKRRRGYEALGYKDWKNYVESEFDTFRQSIDRKVEAESVREELEAVDAPVKDIKLGDSHLLLLSDIPGAEKKAEVLALAAEIANSAPAPAGMAGRYHKPGKVTTAHIKEAIEQVREEMPLPVFAPPIERKAVPAEPVPSTLYVPDPDDLDEQVTIRYEQALKSGYEALVLDKVDTAPECVSFRMHDAKTGKKYALFLMRYAL